MPLRFPASLISLRARRDFPQNHPKEETFLNPDQETRPKHTRPPAPAAEARGHYDTVVNAEERDEAQKQYKPKPEKAPSDPRERAEAYNKKTASENQGR
jgi:hypothetical protein